MTKFVYILAKIAILIWTIHIVLGDSIVLYVYN